MTQEINQAIKVSIVSAAASKATTAAVAGIATRVGFVAVTGGAVSSAMPAIMVGVVAYGLFSFVSSLSNNKFKPISHN